MREYIKQYEEYIIKLLKQGEVSPEILAYHQQQIKWLQHERIVHLLVMLATICIFLATSVVLYLLATITVAILWVLLLLLTIFYVLHYYRLENAVQRWYQIANFLEKQLTTIGVNFDKLDFEVEK